MAGAREASLFAQGWIRFLTSRGIFKVLQRGQAATPISSDWRALGAKRAHHRPVPFGDPLKDVHASAGKTRYHTVDGRTPAGKPMLVGIFLAESNHARVYQVVPKRTSSRHPLDLGCLKRGGPSNLVVQTNRKQCQRKTQPLGDPLWTLLELCADFGRTSSKQVVSFWFPLNGKQGCQLKKQTQPFGGCLLGLRSFVW